MSVILIALLIGTLYVRLFPFEQKINFDDEFGEKLEFNQELARKWAPVFIQYTSVDPLEPDIGYSADFLAKIDYDGDWRTNNNWDNLGNYNNDLSAHVYYWGFTKHDYTILGYMTYHPRDWANSFIGFEHENDAEGVIILLKSINETHHIPIIISTLAHNSLHHYSLAESEIPGFENSKDIEDNFKIDPTTKSPIVFIESMGHGVYASPSQFDPTSTYIKYTAGEKGEYHNPDEGNTSISYSLLPIAPVWNLRYDSDVFFKSGYFKSDNSGTCGKKTLSLNFCSTKKANPPWLWDQNQLYPGQLWYEPVKYYQTLLNLST